MIKINKEELLIGLIGDTHIPSRAPEIPKNIISDFKEKNIDYLIHLGDFTELKVFNDLQADFSQNIIVNVLGYVEL